MIQVIPKLVINLPERKDRLERFKSELSKLFDDTTFNIIEGVRNERSSVGISTAHKNAVKFAKDQGWEYVLVMEDDLKLSSSPNLRWYVNEALNNLPSNWGALSGSCYCGRPNHYNKYWSLVKDFCGCHFMIYKYDSYDSIINHDFRIKNYDREVSKILDIYIMNKLIAKEYPGFSDHLNKEVNHDNHNAKYKKL